MKQIVIDNLQFSYDIGCKILKLKYEECPFEELADVWNDIQPITFAEIAQNIENLENRRVAIKYLGIERFYHQVNPILVDESTLQKSTTWIDKDGNLSTISYKDTYQLFKVSREIWAGKTTSSMVGDVYIVKCKDTSTDREYFIWVDGVQVHNTNNRQRAWMPEGKLRINAIQAIAWTIQTNVPKGEIEKIVRQGDCILIKTKENVEFLDENRHLTEEEYKNLLSLES
jgi:hypothetical protein